MGKTSGALSGIRVLDLTEERGLYAGKMLADLGADVIKIEKPDGGRARRRGPYRDDIPGVENSLYFISYNTNKRSITLDIGNLDGRMMLESLVRDADILIEDFDIGAIRSLRLEYRSLRKINRRLIVASITGFGRTGPYSSFKAPDIVSFATGGLMNINGPEDQAPVLAPCEQSYHSACVASVFGVLAALFLRESTGEGQHIDASTHEVLATIAGGIMQYSSSSMIARRAGSQFGAVPGRIYPCLDGFVHILTIRANHWEGFREVLGNPETLIGKEWYSSHFRNDNVGVIDALVTEFTMAHSKMEITLLCQEKGVPCTPVNTTADFSRDDHMIERGFFIDVEHPVLGRHRYLSPPYALSKTPSRIERPAPVLGEHNSDIYCGELGFTTDALTELKHKGVI